MHPSDSYPTYMWGTVYEEKEPTPQEILRVLRFVQKMRVEDTEILPEVRQFRCRDCGKLYYLEMDVNGFDEELASIIRNVESLVSDEESEEEDE